MTDNHGSLHDVTSFIRSEMRSYLPTACRCAAASGTRTRKTGGVLGPAQHIWHFNHFPKISHRLQIVPEVGIWISPRVDLVLSACCSGERQMFVGDTPTLDVKPLIHKQNNNSWVSLLLLFSSIGHLTCGIWDFDQSLSCCDENIIKAHAANCCCETYRSD